MADPATAPQTEAPAPAPQQAQPTQQAQWQGGGRNPAWTDEQRNRLVADIHTAYRDALRGASGEKPIKSIHDLRRRAGKFGMAADKRGADDAELQELLELAIVRTAREALESGAWGNNPKSQFAAMLKLYGMQMTVGRRDTQREKLQQFSTPIPMSFLADWWVYNDRAGEVESVLEPTAGNGMLLVNIPARLVRANEISERRLANLRAQGFPVVTQQDARDAFDGGPYDAVVANPPFGKSDREMVRDGRNIAGLDRQMTVNMLDAMADDGRAAIIIGGEMEYHPNGAIKNNAGFWSWLYDHYNVKGVIEMAGDLYAGQGTKYPTLMILIDGRRSEEERARSQVHPPVKEKAVGKVDNFNDLYQTVSRLLNTEGKTDGYEEILQSPRVPDGAVAGNASGRADGGRRAGEHRPGAGELPRAGEEGAVGGIQGGLLGVESGAQLSPGRPGVSSVVDADHRTGADGGRLEEGGGRVGNVDDGRAPDGRTGELRDGSGGRGEGGLPQTGGGSRGGPGGNRGPGGRGGTGGSSVDDHRPDDGGVSVGERKPASRPQAKRTLTSENIPYRQHSSARSLESVAPAHMAEAMDKTLAAIEKETGTTVDEAVRRALDYGTDEELHNALAAEQVDSVGMAIHQLRQGQSLIIGDQTGVGKGRQMAALVRYAVKSGHKPVFFTKDSKLFTDLYRDMVDTGSGGLRPLIINSDGLMTDQEGNVVYRCPKSKMAAILASGTIPDGYDYAVVTYSQFSNERQASARMDFLRAVAENNYLMLDESHQAAGDSARGRFLREIVGKARGVVFASATSTKRPDTMPLYSIKSAIGRVKLEGEREVADLVEAGGAPLMEILSRAITDSGQMVRRERDMTGVESTWETEEDPAKTKEARRLYDETLSLFNEICDFQGFYVKNALDHIAIDIAKTGGTAGHGKGRKNVGVDNTPLFSKTHVYIRQLLLALKAQSIVERTDREIREGRHPVIALESTMEAALAGIPTDTPMENDTMALSLLRALEGTMQYTETKNGIKTVKVLPPSKLGTQGERAYYRLREKIMQNARLTYISPIDAIVRGLEAKGYKVGEISGRSLYVDRDEQGRSVVRRRGKVNQNDLMRRFNDGRLDVLILSKSGSTGISLHASNRFKDQRQRSMIIAQSMLDISEYQQMLGRIDRTGQVHRGRYINLSMPIAAEQRQNMMLRKKLKMMNAATTTSQERSSDNIEVEDLINKYGARVMIELLAENHELYMRLRDPLGVSMQTDEAFEDAMGKRATSAKEEDAQKILGRVAWLPTQEQDEFYDEVVARFRRLVEYLDEIGDNDLHIKALPLDARPVRSSVFIPGANSRSGNVLEQDAVIEEIDAKNLVKPMTRAEIQVAVKDMARGAGSSGAWLSGLAETSLRNQREAEQARHEKAMESIREEMDAASKLQDPATKSALMGAAESSRQTVERRHRSKMAALMRLEQEVDFVAGRFTGGSVYYIPNADAIHNGEVDLKKVQEGETTYGVFLGFRSGKKVSRNGVTLVFAPLDGNRRLEVPLANRELIQDIAGRSRYISFDLSEWDARRTSGGREKRVVLTGNVLLGLSGIIDPATGRPSGKVISFTDSNGNVRDGVLMPKNFDLRNVTPNASIPILRAEKQLVKTDTTVVSVDGKVRITSNTRPDYMGGGKHYMLEIPASRKESGKFETPEMVSLTEFGRGFYTYRGRKQAVIPAQNLRRVLKLLSDAGVAVNNPDAKIKWIPATGKENTERGGEGGEAAPGTTAFQRPSRDWSGVKMPELRRELARRGLNLQGNAAMLRARLAGDDRRRRGAGGGGGTMFQKPTTTEVAEAERQYKAVVARYTNPDGSKKPGWRKAPNGADSRLEERAWVQAQTPNFRANYFGFYNLPQHRFNVVATERAPFNHTDAAVAWARTHGIVGLMTDGETNGKGKINISASSIREMLNPRQREKSVSDAAHYAALTKLRDIIRESELADRHPDFKKGPDGKRSPENGVNPNVTVDILYGAMRFGTKTYRVKTTLKRYAQPGVNTKAYAYDVSEIEVLPGTLARPETGTEPTGNTSISGKTLLKGVLNHKKNPVLEDFSKVLDENGEPLVVYHGTNADFWEFDPERVGENYGIDSEGFFFTDDRLNADHYADDKVGVTEEGDPRTVPAFLDMKKPLVVDAEVDSWSNPDGAPNTYFDERKEELLRRMHDGGHDGIIVRGKNGERMFMVVAPNQIKSATDNVGTYSSRNDIRFQKSGLYTGSAADYAHRRADGSVENGPSLHYIGTGEGNQVFGWGLYASNRREVAESYAKKDAKTRGLAKPGGNNNRLETAAGARLLDAYERIVHNPFRAFSAPMPSKEEVLANAIRKVRFDIENSSPVLADIVPFFKETLEELERHGLEYEFRKEHLYEQTFFTNRATPEETERHLLKWYDNVTDEQYKWIMAQIRKERPAALVEALNEEFDEEDWLSDPYVFTDILYTNTGKDFYELLAGAMDSPKAASEFLARAGIDGIKYPVDSYGKTVKDGDVAGWNYVSFRDDNIRVDHKWRDGQMLFQKADPGDEWRGARVEERTTRGGRRVWDVVGEDGTVLERGLRSEAAATETLARGASRMDLLEAQVAKLKKKDAAAIAEARRSLVEALSKKGTTAQERVAAFRELARKSGIHESLAEKEWALAEKILSQETTEGVEEAAEKAERAVRTALARASIREYQRDIKEIGKEGGGVLRENGMRVNVLSEVREAMKAIREDVSPAAAAERVNELLDLEQELLDRVTSGMDADGFALSDAQKDRAVAEYVETVTKRQIAQDFLGLLKNHGGNHRDRLLDDLAAWQRARETMEKLARNAKAALAAEMKNKADRAKEIREELIRDFTGGKGVPKTMQRKAYENTMTLREKAVRWWRDIVAYHMSGGREWGEFLTQGPGEYRETAAGRLLHDGLAVAQKREMEANEADQERALRLLSGQFHINPGKGFKELIDLSEICGKLFSDTIGTDANGRPEVTLRSAIYDKRKFGGKRREVLGYHESVCKLKLGELMSIYLYGKQAEALAGVGSGGFTDTPAHSEWADTSLMESLAMHGYSAETMAEIRRALEARGLDRLALAISADMETKSDALDGVMQKHFHSHLVRIPFYAPLRRVHYGADERFDAKASVGGFMGLARSFLKERVTNYRDIQPSNLIDLWQNHNRQANHLVTHSDWTAEVGRVFRHTQMQEALEWTVGSKARKYLNSWLDLQASGGQYRRIESPALDAIARRFASAVTINPRVALKQLTSGSMALSMLPPEASTVQWVKDMAHIAMPGNALKFHKMLMAESAEWRQRGSNASDAQMLVNRHVSGSKASLINMKINRALSIMTRFGDRGGALMGCYGVYMAWKRKFEAEGMGEREAHAAALERFIDSVNAGQQSSLPEYMSYAQTTGRGFRFFYMFKTAQAAMTKNFFSHADALAKHRGPPKQHIRGMLGIYLADVLFKMMGMAMMPLLVMAGLGGGDDDEKRKRKDKAAWRAEKVALQSLMDAPFSGLFIAGDIASAVTDHFLSKAGHAAGKENAPRMFDVAEKLLPSFDVWNDAVMGVDKLTAGDIHAAAKFAIDAAAKFAGAPYASVAWDYLTDDLPDATGAEDLNTPERIARALTFSRSAIGAPKKKAQ